MYRKEVNAQSPLRILERSIHGGLGKGKLGVVMARAGTGKTACLVQLGLDDLMRDKNVLHIALGGQTVDHVKSWYDELFADLADLSDLADRIGVSQAVSSHRIIHSHAHHALSGAEIDQSIAMFTEDLKFKPDAIIVDGWDWTEPGTREGLETFKRHAVALEAELWLSAQTHRDQTGPHIVSVTAPCLEHLDLIDVALALDPEDDHVLLRLLKDHDYAVQVPVTLQLNCDTMRLAEAGQAKRRPPVGYTLLSGGAAGAEVCFGVCAEKFGLVEKTYSFSGRTPQRTRGLVRLDDDQLQKGDVSDRYLQATMHRTYPQTEVFKRVLQSIWHQVNTAGQVFVVGVIQDDNTVKGGTGWAAELGKHLRKETWIFDQEQDGWFSWTGGAWTACETPRITARRFCGSGTRHLNEAGTKGIEALFENSFPAALTA